MPGIVFDGPPPSPTKNLKISCVKKRAWHGVLNPKNTYKKKYMQKSVPGTGPKFKKYVQKNFTKNVKKTSKYFFI